MSITPPARSGGFDLVNGGPNEGDIAEAPSCGKAAGFAADIEFCGGPRAPAAFADRAAEFPVRCLRAGGTCNIANRAKLVRNGPD
jgi:hypothetical protein